MCDDEGHVPAGTAVAVQGLAHALELNGRRGRPLPRRVQDVGSLHADAAADQGRDQAGQAGQFLHPRRRAARHIIFSSVFLNPRGSGRRGPEASVGVPVRDHARLRACRRGASNSLP